jgi:DNA polymerase II large subunit
MAAASEKMEKYFVDLQNDVERCYELGKKARTQGFDPEMIVDMRLAKNMAERVEGLMSSVAPQLAGTNFTKRIIELEQEYSALDWRVALKIAEEVAKQKFCYFKDVREAMEVGIRAGFTYHTGGIVSAPLEGFVELRIKKTRKGTEYLAPTYAGPIRGAGGTAASMSVIITDYVRHVMGYDKFDPEDKEINRYKTDIDDYHERVTNLQYKPSPEEIEFLTRHLPVQIDGEPTEQTEVSNYKDLDRVETNYIRGGVCLVIAEGLCQKAPKLWKRLSVWGKDFGLDWAWIEDFLALQKSIKSKQKKDEKKGLSPNYTYLSDLVAGRPVLTYPMATGGFRLRYGRSRTSGFSSAGISPVTMQVLDSFIATGTQLKMERPGKAASITPCDTIEGPLVRLNSGSVLKLKTIADARKVQGTVSQILFLGDILFSYGDFSENNHPLVPAGYNEEWWKSELVAAGGPVQDPHTVSAEEAITLSEKYDVPLHPAYTHYWKFLEYGDILTLIDWVNQSSATERKIVLPIHADSKRLLEQIGLEHIVVNNEFIVIEGGNALSFQRSLGFCRQISQVEAAALLSPGKSALENIQALSGLRMRDTAGTFIGARMGRPEKAKMRKMAGSPQVLFPIGEEGGRLRSFQAALEVGKVNADLPLRHCPKCKTNSIYISCEKCGAMTEHSYYCQGCRAKSEQPECKRIDSRTGNPHGPCNTYMKQDLDIRHYFTNAFQKVGDKVYPDLIKGVRGLSSKDHIPEHIVKGILRAKHDVYVNKDGTIRFDMTELPMTHFKPFEIGTPLARLRELGYTRDINGKELVDTTQILELKPQDMVLPAGKEALDEQSDKVLVRIAGFVDELLQKLYGLQPYYNATTEQDLVGHLVIGLAPHISAGIVGRIIGFSRTQGMFAHPLYHAAMRRDCDGDEACVILLMDAVLNFSRQYLPDSRGAKTMDAPLVLTSRLIPTEVDDMAHGLDIQWSYPQDLYEAALELKPAWEVKIQQIKHVLNTEKQYEGMGFTHDTCDINLGINCSAYKALPSMEEKLRGQMALAEKIKAVDANDVARLVIEKHLLRDTKGNLRKFSTQQFRCVKCNDKHRRPPLTGKCSCGSRLIFTVSHGSVIKYLEPTISLAEKYNVSPYLKQTLKLLQLRVDSVFGKEREVQEGLGRWFG